MIVDYLCQHASIVETPVQDEVLLVCAVNDTTETISFDGLPNVSIEKPLCEQHGDFAPCVYITNEKVGTKE